MRFLSICLKGIIAGAEDLLADLKLVKMIADSNLIPFSWGEALNNNENIELLKKNGVYGVIFDGLVLIKLPLFHHVLLFSFS